MTQWRVREVMSSQVVTAHDDASFAQITAILAGARISAIPIVDRFDVVVGVVSWTDLRDKVDIGEPRGDAGRGRLHRWTRSRPGWPGGTAVDVMSAPALTIGPDEPLAAAARVMYRRKVGRLIVTDAERRVVGIVTRSDLLKIHARLDAVIREEVTQRVLRRTLMIEPGTVQVSVEDGVVTLSGRTDRRTTAIIAVRLTEAVAGVARVDDQLTFDIDDTVDAARTSKAVDRDPLAGWWIGQRPGRPHGRTAAGSLPGHAAYAEDAARSEARR